MKRLVCFFPGSLNGSIMESNPSNDSEKDLFGLSNALAKREEKRLEKEKLEKKYEEKISNQHLASYLMYPKVFEDFIGHRQIYSDTSIPVSYTHLTLPTKA